MNKVLTPLESLLTIKDVAAALRASEKTVRRRIDAGELLVVRDGRLLRVRPADLRAYVAARISA
jgi:excisionase family DNA binding protein